jgi:hypothetical protein
MATLRCRERRRFVTQERLGKGALVNQNGRVVLLLCADLCSVLSIPASADGFFCTASTACRSKGHTTFAGMPYPFTEDITGALEFVTLAGPNSSWTTLGSGCSDLNGFNLNGSQPFNTLLRAQITVSSATAVSGARYEVQLLVDGVEHGWYTRRLRGHYPQVDMFAATAQGLAAGGHQFSVQVRLDDGGTITTSNTYITAQGAPTTFPSAQSVALPRITLQAGAYQPVTNTVVFTNAQAVDLAIQGYFSVDMGTPGQLLLVMPFLDGVGQQPRSTVAVPPVLYDGVNVLAAIPNVQPGTHTLALYVAPSGSTSFSARAVEFVSFPVTPYGLLASDTQSTLVDSATSGVQPSPLVLENGCGLWTKLLEGTIPPDPNSYNHVYEGYMRMVPPTTGPPYAELAFETIFPSAGTDGGQLALEVPVGTDGVFLFGDAGAFGENQTETVRLWARKVNPLCDGAGHNGQQGSFWVTDRWMWIRHTPIGGCLYN